jgi:hypothetical protein
MTANEIIQYVVQVVTDNPVITLLLGTSFIEVVPIKVKPWSWLFKTLGNLLNSDLSKKVSDLETKVDDLSKDVADERVQAKRWSILDFSNSCRQGRGHTREEWEHCIEELRWYEKYCDDHQISNGVIEQSTEWLRSKYQEHLDNNDFLDD